MEVYQIPDGLDKDLTHEQEVYAPGYAQSKASPIPKATPRDNPEKELWTKKHEGVTFTADGNNIELYSVWVSHNRKWAFAPTENGNNGKTIGVNARSPYDEVDTNQGLRTRMPVAMFGADGPVDIEISGMNGSKAKVTPVKKGIQATISGDDTKLTLPGPGQYVVEWDDDYKKVLTIFINPLEDQEVKEACDFIFEDGVHNLDGEYARYVDNKQGGARAGVYSEWWPATLTLNMHPDTNEDPLSKRDPESRRAALSWYINPGAVVRGGIAIKENCSLYGYGVIDGSFLVDSVTKNSTRVCIPIQSVWDDNLYINGPTIFDPSGWGMQLLAGTNAQVVNVKIKL